MEIKEIEQIIIKTFTNNIDESNYNKKSIIYKCLKEIEPKINCNLTYYTNGYLSVKQQHVISLYRLILHPKVSLEFEEYISC